MYYVVNYQWNDNYGNFKRFGEALNKFKEINDNRNVIEYYDKYYRRKIVWPKRKPKK